MRTLAVILLSTAGSTAFAEIKAGDTFPSLAASKVVSLRGGALPETQGRVLLVDFWASWCAPCKASFPVMARLHQEYGRRGLTIAAISVDEKVTAAVSFVTKQKPPFATLHDHSQLLVKWVAVPTMPTTYLVGRDGRVRFVHEGFHGEKTERELRKNLETLLSEKG